MTALCRDIAGDGARPEPLPLVVPPLAEVCFEDSKLTRTAFQRKLSQNSKLLIQRLEATPLLESRYTDIKCVNTRSGDEAVGCFSLVFSAIDSVDGARVALKFFDIDPALAISQYRLESFRREHEILKGLTGRYRCLQLVSDLQHYVLSVAIPGGSTFDVICQFFATEWIDDSIEEFFERQDEYSASEKLKLFDDVLAALGALHAAEVAHRDVKPDNLRAKVRALRRAVVAVDMGCAARADSAHLQANYAGNVGAAAYSAPEAFCGLAGDRLLARNTDIYALGCLLFELFNPRLFALALLDANPWFELALTRLAIVAAAPATPQQRRQTWLHEAKNLTRSFKSIDIAASGSTVPEAVARQLNELLAVMTHPNVSQRTISIDRARRTVQVCAKVLSSQEIERQRVEEARVRRKHRADVLTEKLRRQQTRRLELQHAN